MLLSARYEYGTECFCTPVILVADLPCGMFHPQAESQGILGKLFGSCFGPSPATSLPPAELPSSSSAPPVHAALSPPTSSSRGNKDRLSPSFHLSFKHSLVTCDDSATLPAGNNPGMTSSSAGYVDKEVENNKTSVEVDRCNPIFDVTRPLSEPVRPEGGA